MKVVGFWLSEKKLYKIKLDEFAKNYKSNDLRFLKLDLSRPLEEQGPIDVIFHKFIELLVNNGDPQANEQMTRIQTYIAAHPEVICIDPLERTFSMMSRAKQVAEIARCCAHPDLNGVAFVPNFCVLQTNDPVEAAKSIRDANVIFPVLCKPELADGIFEAHEMTIIFNEEGLREVKTPCVAQSFLNHNARLYKIYAMGPYTYTCERPSVKNLSAGDSEPIHFYTNEVSKGHSKSHLNDMSNVKMCLPDQEVFMRIARVIRDVIGVDFFGADVILPNDSNQYAVVDLNSFPGYENVPQFFDNLVSIIREKLDLPAVENGEPSV